MKVMVVGGGGREHIIIKKIKENKKISKIYALPGNGGISNDATCIDINTKDLEKIVKFAISHEIDYAIVSPDDPLVLGAVDKLTEIGIPCFGPDSKAAVIEGSKVFSKNFMKKYGIPTAKYEVFDKAQNALYYLKQVQYPIVIKADGLALGKGVYVVDNYEQASNIVNLMMRKKIFGESGNRIIVEECLYGAEISILAFTDGKIIIPMVSSMDHKKSEDGNKGLNTGGMGAISPNPYYTKEVEKVCMEKIFVPTIEGMNTEGRKFKGCLYFGLMITKDGPKVIEYNCRFGDPEAQTILPLLESDLFEIMLATTNEELSKVHVKFNQASSCCIVLASEGYPKKYSTGFKIYIPDELKNVVNISGAKKEGNDLVTSGGRVLSVTMIAHTLEEAVLSAYQNIRKIKFENRYFRKDIGSMALEYIKTRGE